MARRYSDNTLLTMTKLELIGMIRVAEHNEDSAEDHLRQQAVNMKDWEPVRHERWEEYCSSRFCGFDETGDPIYRDCIVNYCSNPRCRRKNVIKENYCPSCGAKMDAGGGHG